VSGIAQRRGTIGHESTEVFAIPGEHLVERVDDWRQPKPPQRVAELASRPDLSEEHEAAAVVARDRNSVAEHEPPTFAALFLRD
jgi:hypothetical protein